LDARLLIRKVYRWHVAATKSSRSPFNGARTSAAPPADLDFASLYDTWFDHVVRWLRVLRAPEADIEDLAQEVFVVVRRRLPDFDGRNVAGWLHRIASRQIVQHRRKQWSRRVFLLPQPTDIEDLPSDTTRADTRLELQEKQRLLERIVSRMSEKRRVVFLLFEVEGYSGEEIADILDVPANTIWTRLFHARKDFFTFLAQHERTQRGEGS
jgi:RNA polymerase sigma-70 factor, ECF subfamily